MRIAIDVRSLMEGRLSGVEAYTTHLIRSLLTQAAPHECELFYNSWREVSLPLFPKAHVRAFHYPNKLFNLAQYALAQPKWDSLLTADVFFVPNVRLMPLTPSRPLVVTAHDLSFERFPEFYSLRRRLWHRLMRPRQLLQRADHIIAVSQSTKEDVVTLYDIPAERVSVVYSGIKSDTNDANNTRMMRIKYNLPERFVLYLGTLEPRKNVVSIVEAFSAIANDVEHDLVIAGARGWLTRDLDRAIASSSARSRIHEIGFVAEEDKQALYAAADLFVYPSFYEGFGFPPLEALLAGTPVITSHNSALPEVVGEWATLIDPYRPGELAAVMYELLRDLPEVAAQTQQAIREKYSWNRAAAETLAILEIVG